MSEKESTEKKIRNIRRQNRKKYSAEEKIRIVLEGLRGDESIAELCRREGISQSMYYKPPKGDDMVERIHGSWEAAFSGEHKTPGRQLGSQGTAQAKRSVEGIGCGASLEE